MISWKIIGSNRMEISNLINRELFIYFINEYIYSNFGYCIK